MWLHPIEWNWENAIGEDGESDREKKPPERNKADLNKEFVYFILNVFLWDILLIEYWPSEMVYCTLLCALLFIYSTFYPSF